MGGRHRAGVAHEEGIVGRGVVVACVGTVVKSLNRVFSPVQYGVDMGGETVSEPAYEWVNEEVPTQRA